MSPVQVAAIMIDQQADARKWNLSMFQNFLKPSGAWTTSAILSPNDRSKLEAKINEKMAGFRNAGKVPLLDGALEFKPSSVNPSEMDWLESMKYNAGSIANIYNMPPQLIGDTSSTTFDNFRQAEIVSYTEFIFPTLDDLYGLWNKWLLPLYPGLAESGAYLYYDKETVEVVQQLVQAQKDAQADRANKLWLSGLAMQNEARELAGLKTNPYGNVYRIGGVIVSEDKMAAYAAQSLTQPAAPPIPAPEPIQPLAPTTTSPPKPGDNPPAKPGADEPPEGQEKPPAKSRLSVLALPRYERVHLWKALDLSTTEDKSAFAASMEKTRKSWEATYEQKIADYFDSERKAVLAAMKSAAAAGALAGRAEGAINDSTDDLKSLLVDLYEDVAVDIGGQVTSALSGQKGRISDFLKLFGESQIRHLLLLAGTKIKQISSTTLAKVRLELTAGVAAGESIPQMAKRIDSLYLDQIIPNRSVLIAHDEVVESSNYASHESAKQSGLTLNKVWLATDDSHTRPDHADADGQEVGMDEPFDVGGYKMMYPHDSSLGAPANEVCGCRCTQFYKRVQATDDTKQRLWVPDRRARPGRDAYRKFMEEVLR